MEIIELHIDQLIPNTWNPNEMSERVFDAEIKSIMAYGFIDPPTIRRQGGIMEIVDGEHRIKALRQIIDKYENGGVILSASRNVPLGQAHPNLAAIFDSKIIPVIDLGEISDRDAQKLTIILNETRGKASTIKLATLLAAIKDEQGDDYVKYALPYTDSELKAIIDLADENWEDDKGSNAGSGAGDNTDDEWIELKVLIPVSVNVLFDEAKDRIHNSGTVITGKNEKSINGQVLEILLAEFLAAPDYVPTENSNAE